MTFTQCRGCASPACIEREACLFPKEGWPDRARRTAGGALGGMLGVFAAWAVCTTMHANLTVLLAVIVVINAGYNEWSRHHD